MFRSKSFPKAFLINVMFLILASSSNANTEERKALICDLSTPSHEWAVRGVFPGETEDGEGACQASLARFGETFRCQKWGQGPGFYEIQERVSLGYFKQIKVCVERRSFTGIEDGSYCAKVAYVDGPWVETGHRFDTKRIYYTVARLLELKTISISEREIIRCKKLYGCLDSLVLNNSRKAKRLIELYEELNCEALLSKKS